MTTNLSNDNETPNNQTNLQLGDIISFEAPNNLELHNKTFFIKYIDKEQIIIIDDSTLNELTITIDENNNLTDESIESISILNRLDEPSYAKQNDLIPNKWIDLHFSGDVPTIITGLITNLEEDMIEIKTYPDNDVIYIDFGYKGIPLDLPLDKIIIREEPEGIKLRKAQEQLLLQQEFGEEQQQETETENQTEEEQEQEQEESKIKLQEDIINLPVVDVKSQLKQMILAADEIQFGEDLGEITQDIEIESGGQRYSIETQVNDMLDEFLSSIPNNQRTQLVLNRIHDMIDNFVKLRNEYSVVDDNGNATMSKLHGALHKPLVNTLYNFDNKIRWALPIVKITKNLYSFQDSNGVVDDYNESYRKNYFDKITEIYENFKSNNLTSGDNKYDYLIKSLYNATKSYSNDLLEENDFIIDKKHVLNNIEGIVNNLDNFNSSVITPGNFILLRSTPTTRRFVINRYGLGFKRNQTERQRNGSIALNNITLVEPDIINVTGILTLPEKVVNYSRHYSPKSSILTKSILSKNQLYHWKILRQNTQVTTTIIDDLEKSIDYDKETYLKGIREYVLDENINYNADDNDKYKKFLDVITPKTRVLFELIKKYLNNAYSLNNILEYLEPYMIYHKDLSFKQYEAITKYIRYQIKEYKKSFANAKREFDYIKSLKSSSFINVELENLINVQKLDKLNEYNISLNSIIKEYNIENFENEITNERIMPQMLEKLNKILSLDNAKTFTSLIAYSQSHLMIPDMNIENNMENKLDELLDIKYDIKQNENENQLCSKYVIAKKYTSKEDLEEDNNNQIFFDKNFDKTNYNYGDKFTQEMRDMTKTNFIDFLKYKIISEFNLNEIQSIREAEAIYLGKRAVKDGDYAVLVDEDDEGNVNLYNYIRKDDQWVLSDNQEKLLPSLDEKVFCLTSDNNCIPNENIESIQSNNKINNNTCDTIDNVQISNDIDNIKKSIDYFDNLYPQKRTELENMINSYAIENFKNLFVYKKIVEQAKYKFNNQQYELGNLSEDYGSLSSPYETLRDLILNQGDFIKKQYDIIRFVEKFTIQYSTTDEIEDPYWSYCIETKIKLIPTFYERLARVFISNPSYYLPELDKICVERGTLSDDGENWVDRYSGYVLRKVDFDTEEGFTQQGYKIKTREQLETDIGDVIINQKTQDNKFIFDNPDAKIIYNIINTIDDAMGIKLIKEHIFIIRNVLNKIKQIVPNEDAYNKLIQKTTKKNIPSYEDVYNSSLLYLTFSYILVAIQTSIPDITSNKTFPGCKREFEGYPLSNDMNDLSGIKYLVCVIRGIKSPLGIWKSIKKASEATIMKKIKEIIDKNIITDSEIKTKYDEKMSYNLLKENDEIPLEHDIKKWITFLPPLVQPKIKQLEPLSQSFKDELISLLKSGSNKQNQNINVINTKIINYSIAIQELIQKVITTENNLNSKKDDLEDNYQLMRDCCKTTSDITTFDYFVKKQNDIKNYNKIVNELTKILFDIDTMSKAPFLFHIKDTRRKLPSLSKMFSEETIYRAFIHYCRFNSELPIPDYLLPICLTKPEEIKLNDSVEDKIQKLRDAGRVYTKEALDNLMSIINKQNITNIDIYPLTVNKIESLRLFTKDLIDEQNQTNNNNEIIDNDVISIIYELLDTFEFDIPNDVNVPEIRKLRNLLSDKINYEKTFLIEFIKKNNSKITKNQLKDITEFIDTFNEFAPTSSNILLNEKDNSIFNSLIFTINSMRKITEVFPNMVINNFDIENYKNINLHWKLSSQHNSDILNFIQKYYDKIHSFINIKELQSILKIIIKKCDKLNKLVNITPYLIPLHNNDTVIDDITFNLLIKYYFIHCLYIHVSDIENLSKYHKDILNIEFNEQLESNIMDNLVEENPNENLEIMDSMEYIQSENYIISQKMSNYLTVILGMLIDHKKLINYDYDGVMEKVLRSKEREKDSVVNYLKNMTIEEREIENYFKRSKLGRWSKGLKKGLFQYVAEDYDEERKEMEKQMILEAKVDKLHMVSELNKEIYMMDLEYENEVNENIENEEYDISYIGEDDDSIFEEE